MVAGSGLVADGAGRWLLLQEGGRQCRKVAASAGKSHRCRKVIVGAGKWSPVQDW